MPSLDGAAEWLNAEPLGPAELQGQRRPRQLLDTDLHQLAASGTVRPGLVAGLPGRRAGRHRGAHPGVLVRARHRPGAPGDERASDRPIRSPSTTTTRSGAPSATTIGRRSTSSTADGNIRDEHFGEGRYEHSERIIQRLLGVDRALVPIEGRGVEAEADWHHLRTPGDLSRLRARRTVRGARCRAARRTARLRTPGPPAFRPLGSVRHAGQSSGRRSSCGRPAAASLSDSKRATLTSCCHEESGEPIPFRVLIDGEPPGLSHGVDVDEDGNGLLDDGRLYQLVRAHDTVRERTLEITFLEPGAEAYTFTFG